MMEMFRALKQLYSSNRTLFLVIVLVAVGLIIVGCTASGGGTPPPSGPIGGGC